MTSLTVGTEKTSVSLISVLKLVTLILFPVSLKVNHLSDFSSSFSTIIVIVPSVHSDPF